MSDLNLEVGITGNAGGLNTALQGGAKGVQDFTNAVEAGNKTSAASDAAATTAVNAKAQAMKQAGTVSQASGAAAKEAAKGVDALGVSAKQTAAAMRTLPAQFTDVATSLAGGQNPLLVLLQQGGQIKDSFGGAVPAVRALMGLISPTVAIVGASAIAASALTLAWYQGRSEAQEYSKALILTGNAAATTAGQMADQAREIAVHVATQGKAAESLAAMAATGAIARSDLVKTARTAIDLERTLGIALQDTAEKFTALGRDPLQASIRLNLGVNYLTAAVYEQIRALYASGQVAEAASVAQNAYADAMSARAAKVKDNLGFLESGWKLVTDAAKGAWDAMLGIGRADTLDQQLDKVNKRLADIAASRTVGRNAGRRQSTFDAEEAALREQQAALQERQRLERRAAEQQGAQAEANQAELLRKSTAYQAAEAAIARAGAAVRAAEVANSLAASSAEVDRFYREDLISAGAYQAARLALEKAAISSQDQLLAAQRAARASVQPKDQVEARQQAADLVAIDAQRIALKEKLIKLNADEAAGLRDVAPRSTSIGPADALRRGKAADEAAAAQAVQDQKAAAMQAARDLVVANKAGALQMIADDRERGMAQIAMEEEVVRRRLDLNAQSADEQKRLNEELATWRLQREKRLTDQLKPEWQKQLDAWKDNARLMRETQDNVANASIREGEAAWIQFAQTGKLSVKSLGDAIQAEVARGAYRSFVSAMVNLIGNYFSAGSGDAWGSTGFASAAGISGGRAAGGPVEAGQSYLVGERGMEVMTVGNRGGSITPNHAMGGEVSVTVINQTGTQANASATRNSKGGLEILLTAAEDFMAGNVANGTGSLAQAMQGRYGLKAGFGT